MRLTLHVPTAPDDVVQPDFVLPSQTDTFEAIPLGRRQLLSETNPNISLFSHSFFSLVCYSRIILFLVFALPFDIISIQNKNFDVNKP